MPEPAVHEEGELPARQNDVGSAWKVPSVEPEAQAQPVQNSPDCDLGGGIALPDPCHHFASFGRGSVDPAAT